MFNTIREFLEQRFVESSPSSQDFDDHDLQIASIVLLIEMMNIDDDIAPVEHASIIKLVCDKYAIPLEQAEELMTIAETRREQATDHFQFTRIINKSFELNQKIKLIEYLWQVAFADGQLDEREEYLVRKIADLLHVPHSDFIRMKIMVKGE